MTTQIDDKISLRNKRVVVAGGTGNVGGFIVRSLLAAGAAVAVPSRSEEKIRDVRDFLAASLSDEALSRLYTVVGDVTAAEAATDLLSRLKDEWGKPDAAVASLGGWHAVPSLLEARVADLQRPLDDYLFAHFKVARTFLPELKTSGGTYIFINGPLAFEVWPGSKGDLVSIATAAQHMLFQTLAEELKDDPVRIAELVTYAFLRNRQTQPGSPIPGDAVGDYVAALLSETVDDVDGISIRLKSLEQLNAIRQPAEEAA